MTTPKERKQLNNCIRHLIKVKTVQLNELLRQSQCRHHLETYGHSVKCSQCDFYAGDLWREKFFMGWLSHKGE